MRTKHFALLMMSWVIAAAANADAGFEGPVSCTLEKRDETVTTRFHAGLTSSGPYWYSCWDAWYGTNTGLSPVGDQYALVDWAKGHPERSPLVVQGISARGEPISRIYVRLYASWKEATERSFNNLAYHMHLRNYVGSFANGYSAAGCPLQIHRYTPGSVPTDVSFTAGELRAAGGKLSFDVITYDFENRRFDSDRLTCTDAGLREIDAPVAASPASH